MTKQEMLEGPVVHVWTDGSSGGKRVPGGWAAILTYKNVRREISGGMPDDETNNTMELQAILRGLEALHNRPVNAVIHTDSENAINWINGKYRVRARHLQPVVLAIRRAMIERGHAIRFVKVAAHAGIELNERADALAVQAREHAVSLKAPWSSSTLWIDGKQID